MPQSSKPYWTHPSVKALANEDDPVQVVIEKARTIVLKAVEEGWTGPPFDPFDLANRLGIPTFAKEEINDARTVPAPNGRVQIEYNPNQPRSRIRFSVAHEIAHTMFPDCRDRVRNRASKPEMVADEWQLEMLCNIAASEFLMPIGSFVEFLDDARSIDPFLRFRESHDVSIEAVLLRFARLTSQSCVIFTASRIEEGQKAGSYQVDYAIHPTEWDSGVSSGTILPPTSHVAECTAIGFTAKGEEELVKASGHLHVECVGIPPYPHRSFPRVLGVATPKKLQASNHPDIVFLKGDATAPRKNGVRIIAHVVNDRASTWGGGFAKVVRTKFPNTQADFIHWARTHRNEFRLGNSRLHKVSDDLYIFSMVSQHGFGPSVSPRIRYLALEKCLKDLSKEAFELQASIHMPRIACGQAGGRWEIVSEMISQCICRHGISVSIYDIPAMTSRDKKPIQPFLFS